VRFLGALRFCSMQSHDSLRLINSVIIQLWPLYLWRSMRLVLLAFSIPETPRLSGSFCSLYVSHQNNLSIFFFIWATADFSCVTALLRFHYSATPDVISGFKAMAVNVNPFLFAPWGRMKSDGTAPLILNFTRDIGDVSSRSGCFTHRERAVCTHCVGR